MRFVGESRESSVPLAIVDLAGLTVGIILVVWIAYLNKRVTNYSAQFDIWAAFLLWIIFSSVYILVFLRLGNKLWGGLQSVVITSAGGSLLYLVVTMIWSFAVGGPADLRSNGFIFYLIIFAAMFICIAPVASLLRLGANLIAHFQHR